MTQLTDFSATALDGTEIDLARYAGQVVLVVNTASKCGMTPQYEGLESLYRRFQEAGLVVLGFPCDQFGHQEPGSATEIADFCDLNFGVSFPMFAKIDVNGEDAHPVFVWLRSADGGVQGEAIAWNFTKFLVGRDGRVVTRFAPQTTPEDIAGDVEAALAA